MRVPEKALVWRLESLKRSWAWNYSLSHVSLEARRVLEELPEEPYRHGLLDRAIVQDSLGTEVLPKRSSVTSPPVPVWHEPEVQVGTRANGDSRFEET